MMFIDDTLFCGETENQAGRESKWVWLEIMARCMKVREREREGEREREREGVGEREIKRDVLICFYQNTERIVSATQYYFREVYKTIP